MATAAILRLPSTSTTLRLLVSIYKTPEIEVQPSTNSVCPISCHSLTDQTPKLVLENSQEEITGENTISEFLGEKYEKLDWTPELRAETHEWLSRSVKFITNPGEVYVSPTSLCHL